MRKDFQRLPALKQAQLYCHSHRVCFWWRKMLICHDGHQPVIYATWAQTNSQIIFLFLSLNEKETKVLNVMKIRCAGAVSVNQCGLDLHAAKSGVGGTHLTWWTMTLQNSWCVHHMCGDEDMMRFILDQHQNQTPWDWGCLCSEHISGVLHNPISTAYLHC